MPPAKTRQTLGCIPRWRDSSTGIVSSVQGVSSWSPSPHNSDFQSSSKTIWQNLTELHASLSVGRLEHQWNVVRASEVEQRYCLRGQLNATMMVVAGENLIGSARDAPSLHIEIEPSSYPLMRAGRGGVTREVRRPPRSATDSDFEPCRSRTYVY
jgi:hypothetical protein